MINKKKHMNGRENGQTNVQSHCKLARKRLFGPSSSEKERSSWLFSRTGIALESPWIQQHISTCPRCQKRFSALGKVTMSLNLIKSQSHDLGLLKRANTSAVNVLKHDLRESETAEWLKIALPTPALGQRMRAISHSLYQTAACIAILVLSKINVFSSIDHLQKQGQTTVRHFYDSQLGTDLSDDLFPDV